MDGRARSFSVEGFAWFIASQLVGDNVVLRGIVLRHGLGLTDPAEEHDQHADRDQDAAQTDRGDQHDMPRPGRRLLTLGANRFKPDIDVRVARRRRGIGHGLLGQPGTQRQRIARRFLICIRLIRRIGCETIVVFIWLTMSQICILGTDRWQPFHAEARLENAGTLQQAFIGNRQRFAGHRQRIGGIAAVDSNLLRSRNQDHRPALGTIGNLSNHVRVAHANPAFATRTLNGEAFHGKVPVIPSPVIERVIQSTLSSVLENSARAPSPT